MLILMPLISSWMTLAIAKASLVELESEALSEKITTGS